MPRGYFGPEEDAARCSPFGADSIGCARESRGASSCASARLGGLSLAGLLRAEAAQPAGKRRPKSVIYVVLGGGPSHIDTWDPKPDAPVEYRGEFTPIPTKLPGVRLLRADAAAGGDHGPAGPACAACSRSRTITT